MAVTKGTENWAKTKQAETSRNQMKLSGAAGRALRDELRAQLANGLEQTLQIVWLAKNGEASANGFLRLLAISGGEKDRNMGMVAPHEPGKLETRHAAGHEKIGEDEIV